MKPNILIKGEKSKMKNHISFLLILGIGFATQAFAQSQEEEDATGIIFGCSFSGYRQCVLNAIESGGDVNAVLNQTPLMIVSGLGHIGLVQALIDKGADVNASTRTGWTPLTYAVNEGHPHVIRFLLEHDANVEALSDANREEMDRLLQENPPLF